VKSGDLGGARKLLVGEAAKAREQSAAKLAEGLAERSRELATGRQEQAQLEKEIAAMEGQAQAADQLAKKKEDLRRITQELAALEGEQADAAQAYMDQEGETPAVLERKQEYLNLLKQQEELMQSLTQLSEQGAMPTMGGRLDAEVEALNQQLERLEEDYTRLHQRALDTGSLEDDETAKEVLKRKQDVEARRAALDSPQLREMAGLYDARQIASRRAQEESASWRVGYTDTDKLLNEERRLQQELATLRQRRDTGGSLDENEVVRAKTLEIQLWQTQEQIQTRVLELARQEKQIRMDAAREFNKGMLLAGPGEMLQRFHVAEMMRRPGGVSAGEFMALSPETRRLYFDALGGDAGYQNRWERGQMRAHWAQTRSHAAEEYAAALKRYQDYMGAHESWKSSSGFEISIPNATNQDLVNTLRGDYESDQQAGRFKGSFEDYFRQRFPAQFEHWQQATSGLSTAAQHVQDARAGKVGWTVPEEQQAEAAARGQVGKWNHALGGFTTSAVGSQPGMPLPGLDARARQVAEHLGALGQTVALTNRSFLRLQTTMEGFIQRLGGFEVAGGQGHTLDISGGFSLGAVG
jgi:hypothetical protein